MFVNREIAKLHTDEITVLDRGALFWPLYDEKGLSAVHRQRKYDFSRTRQLGYHVSPLSCNVPLEEMRSLDCRCGKPRHINFLMG